MKALLRFLAAPFKLVFDAPRRFFAASLQSRVAVVVAICLILLVALVAIVSLWVPEHNIWSPFLEPSYVVVLAFLVIAIPIVVWRALQLWLEREAPLFPDIELAWNEGLVELQRAEL